MFNSVKMGIAPRHSKNGLAEYFSDAWVHFVSRIFFLFFFGLGSEAISSVVDIDLSVFIQALFFDLTISTAIDKIVEAGGCGSAVNQRRRPAGVELAVSEVYFCDL